MSNTYTIRTDRGSLIVNLAEERRHTLTGNVRLHGRGSENYAFDRNENLIYKLENFAGSPAPSTPLDGQLWWDIQTSTLQVRNEFGSPDVPRWQSVVPTSAGTGFRINAGLGLVSAGVGSPLENVVAGDPNYNILRLNPTEAGTVVPGAGTRVRDLWINADGTLMFLNEDNGASAGVFRKWKMTPAWNFSSLEFGSPNFGVGNWQSGSDRLYGMAMTPDLDFIVVADIDDNDVHAYPLSTPGNMQTIGASAANFTTVNDKSLEAPAGLWRWNGLFWAGSPTGTKLYFADNEGVGFVDLGTAYDISTFGLGSPAYEYADLTKTTDPFPGASDVQVSPDGTRVWAMRASNPAEIHIYDMTVAHDFSTITYEGLLTLDVGPSFVNAFSLRTEADGITITTPGELILHSGADGGPDDFYFYAELGSPPTVGSPLNIGGKLPTGSPLSIEIKVGAATGILVAADSISIDLTALDHDLLDEFELTDHIDHSNVILSGDGLSINDDLTASRTLDVVGGSGITANANDIEVDGTVVRTTGNQTISGVKTFGAAGSIRLINGTSVAPSFSFDGDTDTGIYRSAVNELSFSTGGINRFSILSTGVFQAQNGAYEAIVIEDDDIPNKKYVDDLAAVSAGGAVTANIFEARGFNIRKPIHTSPGLSISGLTAGKKYLVGVYGRTRNNGTGTGTMGGVRITSVDGSIGQIPGKKCQSQIGGLLFMGPVHNSINWPDGMVPQHLMAVITAPAGGTIYGWVDYRFHSFSCTEWEVALHMTAVQID